MWQRLAALGVALVCLLVTVVVWLYADETGRRITDLEFERGARRVERAVLERMRALETMLRAAQGFAATTSVDAGGWRRFSDTLRIGDVRSGVEGLAYLELGDDGTTARILLVEPMARLAPAVGYDTMSDPPQAEALRRAIDAGEPILSGRFRSVVRERTGDRGADMVFVAPLYTTDSVPPTVTERREAARGFVSVGLWTRDLFGALLQGMPDDMVVVIRDEAAENPDGVVLYRSGAVPAATPEGFERVSIMAIGGRVLTLQVWQQPTAAMERLAVQSRTILGGGVLFTLVMGLATWLLVTRRQRAEELARRMTVALQDSEQRYRSLFERNKAVELLIDPSDGAIVDANLAAARFYGWSVDQLKQMRISDINTLSPEEVAEEMARADTERRDHFIFRHRLASGLVRDVEVHSGPVMVGERRLLYSIIHDITRRCEAERKLRDSEIRFRALFEQNPAATLVMATNGRVLRANAAWQAMWGGTVESLHRRGFNLLEDPQLVQAGIIDLVRRALAGEAVEAPPALLDPQGIGFTGQPRWVRGFLYPIRDAAGEVMEVIVVNEDVTERRRAEEELNYRHRLLATQLQTTPDGVAVIDTDWRMESWNQRFVEMWGLPPALVEAGDARAALQHMRAQVATPQVFERRVAQLTAAGTETGWDEVALRDGRVFEVYSRGVPPDVGQAGRRVWFYRDITERKNLEARLRRALEEQDAIFNSAGEGIAFLRGDRFMRTNKRFAALFGYGSEELERLSPAALFADPADYHDFMAAADAAMRETGSYAGEHRMRRRSGGIFWCRLSGTTLERNAPTGGTIWVLADVTRRRLADRRMARLLADLERSNAELQQFAYVASHDLQEPLRMVSSYLGLIEKRYADRLDHTALEFIGFAVDGAHRMQNLINDLLEYSRVGTRGKPLAPTDAGAALEAALENLQVAVRDSGASVQCGPMPQVLADEGQLVRLLQNLIGNALKYHRPGVAPTVRVTAEQVDGQWRFAVADNGIGIEPQYYDRVFMIFQRLHTRQEYSGTGIGLAICKKIVERHHGRIWVESEPGAGSTFFFTLQPADAALGDDGDADDHEDAAEPVDAA
ncbi:hypothetical protein GCM10009099_02960 [Caenispirillum bisanense]